MKTRLGTRQEFISSLVKKPGTDLNQILSQGKSESRIKLLQAVSEHGYFNITSNQINEHREARLMAKFDPVSPLSGI